MCFAEEFLSRYLGVSFSFENQTLLIRFSNILIRFKKLGSTEDIGKGKPRNVKTYRNNLFESGQLSLFGTDILDSIHGFNNPLKPIAITLGYYHNHDWTSVDAIEFLFQGSQVYIPLNEPKAPLIKLSDKKKHPEDTLTLKPKMKAKERRLKNAKRKENS